MVVAVVLESSAEINCHQAILAPIGPEKPTRQDVIRRDKRDELTSCLGFGFSHTFGIHKKESTCHLLALAAKGRLHNTIDTVDNKPQRLETVALGFSMILTCCFGSNRVYD